MRGLRTITSSIRDGEVRLVQEFAAKIPPHWANTRHDRRSIAGAIRVFVRYGLEHQDEVLAWLKEQDGKVVQ